MYCGPVTFAKTLKQDRELHNYIATYMYAHFDATSSYPKDLQSSMLLKDMSFLVSDHCILHDVYQNVDLQQGLIAC